MQMPGQMGLLFFKEPFLAPFSLLNSFKKAPKGPLKKASKKGALKRKAQITRAEVPGDAKKGRPLWILLLRCPETYLLLLRICLHFKAVLKAVLKDFVGEHTFGLLLEPSGIPKTGSQPFPERDGAFSVCQASKGTLGNYHIEAFSFVMVPNKSLGTKKGIPL